MVTQKIKMGEIAKAISGLTEVVAIWMKGSEIRRQTILTKAVEEMFDLIETDTLTPKYFKHYKKRIRANL